MKAVGAVMNGRDSTMIKATVCHCRLNTYEMRGPIKISWHRRGCSGSSVNCLAAGGFRLGTVAATASGTQIKESNSICYKLHCIHNVKLILFNFR
jgi:hypothetical protein